MNLKLKTLIFLFFFGLKILRRMSVSLLDGVLAPGLLVSDDSFGISAPFRQELEPNSNVGSQSLSFVASLWSARLVGASSSWVMLGIGF